MQGTALKYGNDINTDVIIPSKFLVYTNPYELAKYAMAGLDSTFLEKIKLRSILVAGTNFGCGSSREQAPIALKYAGVQCILADSFARIFYRNAINIGLPIMERGGISNVLNEGDEVYIDFKRGIVNNLTQNVKLQSKPLPDFLLEIMENGLVNYMKEKRKEK
ncbi:MAG: 3-isopropylmalate dehydratase small subunit [Candidatus Bathyarchaeota archaeon]|nr:MAG: 3-isopropylmalate dehydratase small subunit [Candidatus Bathyarchaeota archaeon]